MYHRFKASLDSLWWPSARPREGFRQPSFSPYPAPTPGDPIRSGHSRSWELERFHTRRIRRFVHVDPEGKAPRAGFLPSPSDGLEPSTQVM